MSTNHEYPDIGKNYGENKSCETCGNQDCGVRNQPVVLAGCAYQPKPTEEMPLIEIKPLCSTCITQRCPIRNINPDVCTSYTINPAITIFIEAKEQEWKLKLEGLAEVCQAYGEKIFSLEEQLNTKEREIKCLLTA
jgi:hypothetical protein